MQDPQKPGELARSAPAASAKRVLLAEDDDDVRSVFELVISERFQVRCASNAEQALSLARSWMPDVMLIDWVLPDASGEDVVQRLRTMGAYFATLPIVVVSGAPTLKSLAAKIGAIPCPKPCGVDELLGAIENALGMAPRP